MFDIGFSELLLIAVIALLVLGPERLPSAARTVGSWVGRARRMMNQLNQEIDKQIKLEELKEKLRQEGDTLGAEKIQETVDSALQEAKKFEHLVNQEVSTSASKATGGPEAKIESAAASGQPEPSAGQPESPLATGSRSEDSAVTPAAPESRQP